MRGGRGRGDYGRGGRIMGYGWWVGVALGGVRVGKVSCGFPEAALDAKLRNLCY